ncbi:MAG: 3-deoxy-manno-octulosonate cytidylyltransferase [Bacteroidales bacterium]|nr:3-deoxy-manno-octulosonate cytidylyltransferase [Bacteroidales bacterium]
MIFIAIFPARYASTRFPGKPLADMNGKPMIQRVYEQVKKCVDKVFVATDDERIYDAVTSFGGNVVMTSANHKSGTDRCAEAYNSIGGGEDVIINIQGDEPFIAPSQIEAIMGCFFDKSVQIATLVKPFTENDGIDALINPNSPKVVLGVDNQALYFSRSVIPFVRGVDMQEWLKSHTFYKHIGMYAYRAEVLMEITKLPQSELEKAESLEQLRWLENGYKIKAGVTTQETIGIDTPDDMQKALVFMQSINRE